MYFFNTNFFTIFDHKLNDTLRNAIIFMLALMLIVPPAKAHVDDIVHHNNTLQTEVVNDNCHIEQHHENHNEDDSNTGHHHHCNVVSVANAIISPQISYQFIEVAEATPTIVAYKNLYNSSYLDNLFQPPRA